MGNHFTDRKGVTCGEPQPGIIAWSEDFEQSLRASETAIAGVSVRRESLTPVSEGHFSAIANFAGLSRRLRVNKTLQIECITHGAALTPDWSTVHARGSRWKSHDDGLSGLPFAT
jgi:hypothetical protein